MTPAAYELGKIAGVWHLCPCFAPRRKAQLLIAYCMLGLCVPSSEDNVPMGVPNITHPKLAVPNDTRCELEVAVGQGTV